MADNESLDVVPELHLPKGETVDRRTEQRSSGERSDNSHLSGASNTSTAPTAPDSRATSVTGDGPTFQEEREYYGGIGGNPLLISRSDQRERAFVPQYDGEWRVGKVMDRVGRHPITEVYDQHLRDPILELVTSAGLQWVTIDVLRIGWKNKNWRTNPVVVLIRVKKGGRGANNNVVNDIHNLLKQHGLSDVHAEIMAIDDLPQPFFRVLGTDPMIVAPPYKKYPEIGQSIGIRLSSDGSFNRSTGTLGLYLEIHGKWFGLTCHHVPFSGGRDVPRELQSEDTTKQNIMAYNPTAQERIADALWVSHPSNFDHENGKIYYEKLCKTSAELIELLDEKIALRSMDLNDDERTNVLRTRREQEVEELVKLEKLLVDLIAEDDSSSGEVVAKRPLSTTANIGQVYRSSGKVKDPVTGGSQDWALIELATDRFKEKAKILNQLPPFEEGETWFRRVNHGLETNDQLEPAIFMTNPKRFGKLSDITKPSAKLEDGEPCLRVVKHGRSTKWTVGQSNEIKSNCQRSHGIITKEWCILDDNSQISSSKFSSQGDSGAMIFDFHANIQGMVAAGIDGGLPGMTYAIPIEWLLDDIEAKMGGKITNLSR